MKHFIIFSLGLNLIAGTGVFLYAYQVYGKYGYRYLKTLVYYILFFNIMIFMDLIFEYVLINLFNNDVYPMLQMPVIIFMSLLILVVFSAEFGITFSLYRIVTYLKKNKMSRRVNSFFIVWVAVSGTGTLLGMFLTYRTSALEPFRWTRGGWIFSVIILIIACLISLLIFSRRNHTNENSIKPFAWLFLAGYAGFTLSHLDFYFFRVGIEKYFDPLILLLTNLCPFLWLRFYFIRQNLTPSAMERIESILNSLYDKHNISKREKEIIALILAGKSNKEIEDALYISFNTVKNHIYNIYQKFGVQSRSQLTHHINRHAAEAGS